MDVFTCHCKSCLLTFLTISEYSWGPRSFNRFSRDFTASSESSVHMLIVVPVFMYVQSDLTYPHTSILGQSADDARELDK